MLSDSELLDSEAFDVIELEMLLQQNWGSTCWIFGCRIWKQSYQET
jgi:hypothetical protein